MRKGKERTEKKHRRTHDSVEHSVVHDLRGANHTERVQEQSIEEEGETSSESKGSVDAEVPRQVAVIARDLVVRRPVLEPDVRSDLESLLEDDRRHVQRDLQRRFSDLFEAQDERRTPRYELALMKFL